MEMMWGPGRGPVAAEDLPDLYPWPDRGGVPWLRTMTVGTLDGAAAGPDGLSGSVSTGADRSVLTAVRRYADVVLVGGGTLAAERYGPLRATEADRERRSRAGQAPAPVIATLSRSLRLPLDEDGFTSSPARPLVFTTADPDPGRLAAVRERCEVVQADADRVDVGWVVDELRRRGLWRIVCEGGPTLLREVAAAGLVDEVDLTLSPLLVGTSATGRTESMDPASFALRHVLTGDDCLMTRFVRASPA